MMYKQANTNNAYELVTNDNKITIVINYEWEVERKIKSYKIPVNFSETTLNIFNDRLDKMIKSMDFQTCNIFLNGYVIGTIEELQELYKKLYK